MPLCFHSSSVQIVELRDILFGPQDVSLVFEYVESTLKRVILDIRRPRNDDLTRFFFVQLLRGIDHLHGRKIMHRVSAAIDHAFI